MTNNTPLNENVIRFMLKYNELSEEHKKLVYEYVLKIYNENQMKERKNV